MDARREELSLLVLVAPELLWEQHYRVIAEIELGLLG